MTLFTRTMDRLSKMLFLLGGCALLLVLGLTLANIILRPFGHSIRGVVEISGYLAGAALGLCLPWVQRHSGHMTGGVWFQRMPLRAQKIHNVLVPFLCLLVMFVVTRELIDFGMFVHEGMETIDGWNISYTWFIGALALGCAVQSLVLGHNVCLAVKELCCNPA